MGNVNFTAAEICVFNGDFVLVYRLLYPLMKYMCNLGDVCSNHMMYGNHDDGLLRMVVATTTGSCDVYMLLWLLCPATGSL